MFDYPVTLRTEVPAGWKTCTVTQENHSAAYPVKAGAVQYWAIPNAGDISIVPGGTPAPPPASLTALSPTPPSPPPPPLLPTQVIEDFDYFSDAELNSAWWVVPCGNETRVSLDPTVTSEYSHAMNYSYAAGGRGISGRLRRNTSLDLSPYKYISLRFKPSNTNDAITFQFMEAIQSEFWEASVKPNSTADQIVVIPLTREYFHHPVWFSGADADGVIDLSNIKLVSLFVSGKGGGRVIFDDIEASQEKPPGGYVASPQTAVTPSFTETGRCAPSK